MEARRDKRAQTERVKTKRELIVAHWKQLGRPAVGADELTVIQQAVTRRFGESWRDSPAAIGRVLADEGADLRHPEMIECDTRWRAARMQAQAAQFSEIELLMTGKALTLKQAEVLIEKLDELRERFAASDAVDPGDTQRLRLFAVEARNAAQLEAKKRSLNEVQKAEQAEIAEWLAVWIKTPKLFQDWLELRRRSTEFRQKFLSEAR